MLPETKQYVASLKAAGLTRSQFRIHTPWKASTQQYGKTRIELTCPFSQLAPHLQALAMVFQVTVTCLDGTPVHVSLETEAEPGLYKRENGVVEHVSAIVSAGEFAQLPLWKQEEAVPF